jgi:hypothetical protein
MLIIYPVNYFKQSVNVIVVFLGVFTGKCAVTLYLPG